MERRRAARRSTDPVPNKSKSIFSRAFPLRKPEELLVDFGQRKGNLLVDFERRDEPRSRNIRRWFSLTGLDHNQ